MSAKKACFQFAECSFSSAKKMQTSAKKACFQFAECSFSSAKIRLFVPPNAGEEYEQTIAKSKKKRSIWLSYHLFLSQIERFFFDLAKESLAFSNIFLKFATQ